MIMTTVMLLVIVLSYLLMLGLVKFASSVIDKVPAARLRSPAPPSEGAEQAPSMSQPRFHIHLAANAKRR
jgi:hypothetical protein